jgi:hypothetical protein
MIRIAVALAVALLPQNPSAPADTGHYYVVGDGSAYLFQIAADTLGDGRRFRELEALNVGRAQSDGGALDGSDRVRVGWVLALPADAQGPGVMTGPLPVVTARGRAEPAPRAPGVGYLAGISGLAALLAGFLVVRGRRRRAGVMPAVAGHWVAGRADLSPGGGALAERGETVGSVAVVGDGDGEPDGGALPGGDGDLATAVEESVGGALSRDAGDLAAAIEEPLGGGDRVGVPVGVGTVPVPAIVDGTVELPILGGNNPAVLHTRLDCLTDRLDVRLRGIEGDLPAYAWVEGDDDRLAGALLPVVLGRRGLPRLAVDLGRVPDLLTVGGPSESRRRQALEIARQAHQGGATVIVVGDVLGADVPGNYLRFAAYPMAGDELAGPVLVVSGGLRGPELRAARRLAAGTEHRVVPMLVGDVVRSRWSIVAEPVVAPPAAPPPLGPPPVKPTPITPMPVEAAPGGGPGGVVSRPGPGFRPGPSGRRSGATVRSLRGRPASPPAPGA